jgi:hypothetical protein
VEVDWVRARQYASSEPSVSFGIEESDERSRWVELYNPTQVSYDISGWTLKNAAGTVYTFPASTTLAANEYIVASVESLGSLDGVSLYDLDGAMRDYVCWGDAQPTDANYNAAVASQNWYDGTYVDISSYIVSNTLGRDKYSTDNDAVYDWEATCGIDAGSPTPIEINAPEFPSVAAPLALIAVPLILWRRKRKGC